MVRTRCSVVDNTSCNVHAISDCVLYFLFGFSHVFTSFRFRCCHCQMENSIKFSNCLSEPIQWKRVLTVVQGIWFCWRLWCYIELIALVLVWYSARVCAWEKESEIGNENICVAYVYRVSLWWVFACMRYLSQNRMSVR